MMQNQPNKFRFNDYGRLNILAQLVCYRLDDLIEKLEIDLRCSGRMYIGCCPIHLGDNYSALNLYPEGDIVPGTWVCHTRACHRVFKNTIIGFVRGVLSQKYFGWAYDSPKDNMAPFDKVLTWLCKFVEKDWNDIKVDERTVELNKFSNQVQLFKKKDCVKQSGLSREKVRKNLQIPAEYYISRNYRSETLDTFDVGLCIDSRKEMFNRAVVPIYNNSGKFMVGCTGRSIFSKCNTCRLYHSSTQQCPVKSESKLYSKWRHSGDTGSILYNWWNAKGPIRNKARAVLVESPGNVWRLYEAGVDNAVAMFGATLTDEQQILLECSGAMALTVICDNDVTGKACAEKLREQLHRSYKLRFVMPSVKDVGELTVEQVKQEIVPCLI